MFLSRRTLAFSAMALAAPLSLAAYSPAIAGEDYAGALGLGHYQPEIQKAVQQALHDKRYYAGAIDGRVGPKTRAAVLKFRAANHIRAHGDAAFVLDAPLVKALFGLPDSGIHSWRDEGCLLSKLGKGGEAQLCRD